jgi:prepilin-type processing-associated H-X9-DG protein
LYGLTLDVGDDDTLKPSGRCAGRSIVLDLVSCKAHERADIELYETALPAIRTGQERWAWQEVRQRPSIYAHRTPCRHCDYCHPGRVAVAGANYRQLQLGWLMYAHDNNESLTRNVWQDEQAHVQNENWLSGWLDPIAANITDNTNTALLVDVKWATLGPYTRSPGVYRCAASRVTCLEGNVRYPLCRNVSMSVAMGTPDGAFDGKSFHKLSDITRISPSLAFVFIDERDDSIDDGEFLFYMAVNQIPNFPAAYHAGSGGISFADGHAEIHRYRTAEFQPPQTMGQETVKRQFTTIPANNIDMLWMRAHLSVPGP